MSISDPIKHAPEPLLYKACNDAISKGGDILIKLYKCASHPHNGGMCEVHYETLLEAAKVIEHARSLLGLMLAREQEEVRHDRETDP